MQYFHCMDLIIDGLQGWQAKQMIPVLNHSVEHICGVWNAGAKVRVQVVKSFEKIRTVFY